ncbi:MAG TPA: tRNA lysidine(34) synthetase TilS [Blastocatellia bacterium]|nr:tRNA lysidine(34) synthetase TilS [Blastocatellia bacterium]
MSPGTGSTSETTDQNGLYNKVKLFAARNSMLAGARGVVVAVSGGPDSVALLDMLARLATEGGNDPPIKLHVAHLDHRLRGKQSADDAEFVRALAERSGFTVTIASADVRAKARSERRSIEEVAREIRYRFLLATARQEGCDRIATGHTMTDQAETFLMRLARGAALRGLSAMSPVLPAHSFGEVEAGEAVPAAAYAASRPLLIRPLLVVTREEVEAYCRDRGLEYRLDVTNEQLDYTRNRVRKLVLPALAEINPRVVESLARTVELVRADNEALESIASSMLDRARVEPGPGQAGLAYSARALVEQPLAIRRRMIVEALRRLAEIEEGAAFGQITSKHVAAVNDLLESARSGKRVELPTGVEVWREPDRVVFKRAARPDYELALSRSQPRTVAGGLEIVLERGRPGAGLEAALEEARSRRKLSGRDWTMAVLDDGLLPEDLAVRPRRTGERASVLGQRRTKKLKNLMIDHKIPSSRRANWPVVATPDGLYIWSPGLPPAKEFAARDETRGLAILRAKDV